MFPKSGFFPVANGLINLTEINFFVSKLCISKELQQFYLPMSLVVFCQARVVIFTFK